jgi:MarR family transcriptional regulator for hemolysin
LNGDCNDVSLRHGSKIVCATLLAPGRTWTSPDARIEYAGVNRTQWRLLAYLLKDDGMTQTELSRCLEIERTTVGQAVDELELLGLVEPRASDRDRRVWHFYTLSKAQALVPECVSMRIRITTLCWAA